MSNNNGRSYERRVTNPFNELYNEEIAKAIRMSRQPLSPAPRRRSNAGATGRRQGTPAPRRRNPNTNSNETIARLLSGQSPPPARPNPVQLAQLQSNMARLGVGRNNGPGAGRNNSPETRRLIEEAKARSKATPEEQKLMEELTRAQENAGKGVPGPPPNYKLGRAPGDGNCFFHSLIRASQNHEKKITKSPEDMRREIAKQLLKNWASNPSKKIEVDRPVHRTYNFSQSGNYIKRLTNGKLWAGTDEIQIASKLYEKNIIVVSRRYGNTKYPIGENHPDWETVYINYVGDGHYDPYHR